MITVESPKANMDEAVIDTIPEEGVHIEDNYEHVEEVEVFTTREAPVEENATPISIHHHDAVVKQPEEQPATTYEEENSSGIGTVKLSYASIVSFIPFPRLHLEAHLILILSCKHVF